MNVIGKAITPAVMITESNSTPKIDSVNGRSQAVKNLLAVASAMTSAATKMDAQTTNSFCGRERTYALRSIRVIDPVGASPAARTGVADRRRKGAAPGVVRRP